MNNFFKYIIYFLLGLMIHFLFKNKLIEGYGENAFVLFSRIMGTSENNDYRSPYMGCQNYECHNKPNYSFKELNSKELDELKGILREMSNETRLTEQEIISISKENAITEILKIDKAKKYIDKEVNNNNIDYLTCNNEMDYSAASLLGGANNRCNHQKCCFNTKCSSQDVQNLTKDDGTSLSCINGTVLKKNSNCLNEIECKDNYQLHCCTDIIDSISEFQEISGDDEFISFDELTNQYQELTSEQMDKILSISRGENINLDEYDFYSLK